MLEQTTLRRRPFTRTALQIAIVSALGFGSAAVAQDDAPAAWTPTLVAPSGWQVPRLADGKPVLLATSSAMYLPGHSARLESTSELAEAPRESP